MNNESDDFIDDSKYALDAWIREDYKTAYKVLLPLAEQEDAGAQFLMGLMYSSGLGVSQDIKTAFKWFRLAADQGDPDAQYVLGVSYDWGETVHKGCLGKGLAKYK